MDNQLHFLLPDNSERIAAVIQAIGQRKWHWVNGQIDAPADLIDAGLVRQDTGYNLSRFYPTHPLVVPRRQAPSGETQIEPDLFGLVIAGLLPGFVRFDETGFDNRDITVAMAFQAAVSYIRRGYLGQLHFRYGWHGNNPLGNELRCDVHMQRWAPLPFDRRDWLVSPMVKLGWVPKYGGSQKDYHEIVEAFKRLGLAETPLEASFE